MPPPPAGEPSLPHACPARTSALSSQTARTWIALRSLHMFALCRFSLFAALCVFLFVGVIHLSPALALPLPCFNVDCVWCICMLTQKKGMKSCALEGESPSRQQLLPRLTLLAGTSHRDPLFPHPWPRVRLQACHLPPARHACTHPLRPIVFLIDLTQHSEGR